MGLLAKLFGKEKTEQKTLTYFCDATLESEKSALIDRYAQLGVTFDIDDMERFIEFDIDTGKLRIEKYTEHQIVDSETGVVLHTTHDYFDVHQPAIKEMFDNVKSNGSEIKYKIEPSDGRDEPEFVESPFHSVGLVLIHEFDLNQMKFDADDDFIYIEGYARSFYEVEKCCCDEGVQELGYENVTLKIPNVYRRLNGFREVSLSTHLKNWKDGKKIK